MGNRHTYSLLELSAMATRMVARGGTTTGIKLDQQLLHDCLVCGRLLAQLLATNKIQEPVIFGDFKPTQLTACEND